MSRVIDSPVKRWPGRVILPDYLTAPQDAAFEDALAEARNFDPETQGAHYTNALIPGVLACVEKWELEGFPQPITADNFPKTPRQSFAELLAFLIREVTKIYEDEPVPNA